MLQVNTVVNKSPLDKIFHREHLLNAMLFSSFVKLNTKREYMLPTEPSKLSLSENMLPSENFACSLPACLDHCTVGKLLVVAF